MATLTPDPTFYPSPRMAMQAPPEQLGYVVEFNPERRRSDRLAMVDLDTHSATYAQDLGRVNVPGAGDELHYLGWNACSSCLCPNAPRGGGSERLVFTRRDIPGAAASMSPIKW